MNRMYVATATTFLMKMTILRGDLPHGTAHDHDDHHNELMAPLIYTIRDTVIQQRQIDRQRLETMTISINADGRSSLK